MDEPIQRLDDDFLGRKEEAAALASYPKARDETHNLIAGIEAPWGEGKSSYLNLVNCKLGENSDGKIKVIRFNPWQFSGHQDLLQQFFMEFSTAEGVSDSFKKTLSSMGKLASLTAIVPGLELVGLIGKVLDKGADFAGSVPSQSLKDTRKKTIDEANKQDCHYIFLIDELDRLESNEVRAFLQMLKAVADFPKTTYVLAYDSEALEGLLKESGVHDPRTYLEKIIGFSWSLASITTANLKEFHFAKMNEILNRMNLDVIDSERWLELDVYASLPNLRQCKRHLAQFEFLLICIGKYVDTTDLAYVSIIQLLDPRLWRTIGENKSWFCGSDFQEDKPHKELIELRNECFSRGGEVLWDIICIVYKGILNKIESRDQNFMISDIPFRNAPIRAKNSNVFAVYHTRTPTSDWSTVETSILKDAFIGKGDKQEIYKLLIQYPDESFVWLRHIIRDASEYKGFEVSLFMKLFIELLEDHITKPECQKLLLDWDVREVIQLASDFNFGKELFCENFSFGDKYKSSPLYYALEVQSLYQLRNEDDLTADVQDRLGKRHEAFWNNVQDKITHPFIQWAFESYRMTTNEPNSYIQNKFMEPINKEPFYLTKEALPRVLFMASVLIKAGISPRGYTREMIVGTWKFLLGKEPNLELLLKRIIEVKGAEQPEAIEKAVRFWDSQISNLLQEESESAI